MRDHHFHSVSANVRWFMLRACVVYKFRRGWGVCAYEIKPTSNPAPRLSRLRTMVVPTSDSSKPQWLSSSTGQKRLCFCLLAQKVATPARDTPNYSSPVSVTPCVGVLTKPYVYTAPMLVWEMWGTKYVASQQ